MRPIATVGLALLVAGCATKGAVRRVETEVAVFRTQVARQDSARAAELARIMQLQARILDSLAATREAIRVSRSELGSELINILEQLAQIQELTGQTQSRLNQLRRDIDDRSQLFARDTAPPPPVQPGDSTPPAPPPEPTATPDQLYQASLVELRRSSMSTARFGFQEFVRLYPTHPQMPDVLHFLAATFEVEAPDSATYYHGQVVSRFPQSSRAPTSLYKIGLLAEQRGDRAAARAAYERVLRDYPRADEVNLARQKLAALRP